MDSPYSQNPLFRNIFNDTRILRKPISGIVSGYHDLQYILVAPNDENTSHSIEINGKINVSPKFIISPSALQETYGEVFDPATFDQDIHARLFSFALVNKRNVKVENEYFSIKNLEENADAHVEQVYDELLRQENLKTGLIFSPHFKYYPISIDRFINEILDREFRV